LQRLRPLFFHREDEGQLSGQRAVSAPNRAPRVQSEVRVHLNTAHEIFQGTITDVSDVIRLTSNRFFIKDALAAAASAVILSREELLKEAPELAAQACIRPVSPSGAQESQRDELTSGMLIMAATPVLGDDGQVLAVVISQLLANSIMRPIRSLVLATNDPANGNLERKVQLTDAPREICPLGQSF